jgi:hypothetical protein
MSFLDELVARHRQTRTDIDREQSKAQDLLASAAKKKRALEAIEELIQLEGGEVPQESQPVVPFPGSARMGTPISDAAYAVLEERGEPMHYHPLTRVVQLRGIEIGGQNPANTLLAHLSRDDRFYRPSRGTYALREWDPKARSVGVRRRKGA